VTKTQALLSWLVSLAFLAITAGQSWLSFEVSESAGGGVIHINGFMAFPVVGTLIALQVVIILVGLLVKPIITRILAATTLPLMIWTIFEIALNSEDQVEATLMRALASQTGVLEELSTSEFLVSSTVGFFTTLFLISAALNSVLLAFMALFPPKSLKTKASRSNSQLPEDLWSSQN
jgi:hypothetical protein